MGLSKRAPGALRESTARSPEAYIARTGPRGHARTMPTTTPDLESLIAANPFDPQAAIEAVQLLAQDAEAMVLTLRRELERTPIGADQDAPEGAVGRGVVIGRLAEVAEGDVRSVRTALGLIGQRLAAVRVGRALRAGRQ